jgi:hypothetical protein
VNGGLQLAALDVIKGFRCVGLNQPGTEIAIQKMPTQIGTDARRREKNARARVTRTSSRRPLSSFHSFSLGIFGFFFLTASVQRVKHPWAFVFFQLVGLLEQANKKIHLGGRCNADRPKLIKHRPHRQQDELRMIGGLSATTGGQSSRCNNNNNLVGGITANNTDPRPGLS